MDPTPITSIRLEERVIKQDHLANTGEARTGTRSQSGIVQAIWRESHVARVRWDNGESRTERLSDLLPVR